MADSFEIVIRDSGTDGNPHGLTVHKSLYVSTLSIYTLIWLLLKGDEQKWQLCVV
jgi:hypothetical protein